MHPKMCLELKRCPKFAKDLPVSVCHQKKTICKLKKTMYGGGAWVREEANRQKYMVEKKEPKKHHPLCNRVSSLE